MRLFQCSAGRFTMRKLSITLRRVSERFGLLQFLERKSMTAKPTIAFLICLTQFISAFSFAAAPESTQSDQASLIEQGRYLAIAGNCATCHTSQSGSSYAGGSAFKTDFGTVYSTNITPDKATGIGNWSEEEFREALWHGTRPNGEHLYPVFPYTSYSGLSSNDVRALYYYMQTVPAVSYTPPNNELTFPFNYRFLLGIWKKLYFKPARFSTQPERSSEWNRGAYLVNHLGHCGACHTPRNFLGAEKSNLALTGGSYIDKIPNGEYRNWHAVDLTSSEAGLDKWLEQDIFDYLKTGINAYATSFGPMNKIFEDSTRFLADQDLNAIALYLKSLPPSSNGHANGGRQQTEMSGETLYSVHCATCHLPTGKGDPDTGPSMIGNPVVEAADPSSLINVILYGPELPAAQFPVQRTAMDAYEHLLNDEEIAAISNYMRAAWGNTGAPVTAKQVLKQR